MSAKNKLFALELVLTNLTKDHYIDSVEKPPFLFEKSKRLYELETMIKGLDETWRKGEQTGEDPFQELWIPVTVVHAKLKEILDFIKRTEV